MRFILGDKTVEQWESTILNLGILSDLQGNLKEYNRYVGVYMAYLDDKLVYIGSATENLNGGFRKRLTDYVRDSDSGRTTESGRLMYEHRANININIIKTGSDVGAIAVALGLEVMLINKYDPEWNIRDKKKSKPQDSLFNVELYNIM